MPEARREARDAVTATRQARPAVAPPARDLRRSRALTPHDVIALQRTVGNRAVQALVQRAPLSSDTLNVVGEHHGESQRRRAAEKEFCATQTGSSKYWLEQEFRTEEFSFWKHYFAEDKRPRADPFDLRWRQAQAKLVTNAAALASGNVEDGALAYEERFVKVLEAGLRNLASGMDGSDVKDDDPLRGPAVAGAVATLRSAYDALRKSGTPATGRAYRDAVAALDALRPAGDSDTISTARGAAMHGAASKRAAKKGVWKVGDDHRAQMAEAKTADDPYTLVSRAEFNAALEEHQRGKGGASAP